MQSHDTNYSGLKGNIKTALDSGMIDHISVYSRKIDRGADGAIVNNAVKLIHRSESDFTIERVISAINSEQTRPFSPVEKTYLAFRFDQVINLINDRRGNPESFILNSQSLLNKIEAKPDRGLKI